MAADTANIGTPKTMKLTELNTYHKNPRRGDTAAIAASMEANGVFRPLVVNKGTHTGRPMEVLAGNHSLMAMRDLAEKNPHDKRWHKADVYLLDVDDDRAARIVLADNRTSDLASYDDTELLGLLEQVEDDLTGTAYTEDDLHHLFAATSSAADELAAYLGSVPEEDAEAAPGTEPGAEGSAAGDHPDGAHDPTNPDPPAPESDTAGPTPGDANLDWVPLTFSVTPEQRHRARAVISTIRNEKGLDTQAEALMWALDHIEGYDSTEAVEKSAAAVTGTVTESK